MNVAECCAVLLCAVVCVVECIGLASGVGLRSSPRRVSWDGAVDTSGRVTSGVIG